MQPTLHLSKQQNRRNQSLALKASILGVLFLLIGIRAWAGTIPVPGDIIFNEYAADNNANGNDFFELLVLTDGLDLRGLRVSDNEVVAGVFNNGESVFVFGNDSYLNNVPRGTLIAVWTIATGVTTDIVVNPAANDWKMVLAPGTGVASSVDGLGGSVNAGLSNSGEALYLYLPGPDGTSAGTDNIYLDFISSEGGATAPAGLTNIDLPSLSDNAYYTGNTAAGNDVVANWFRYDGAPNANTTAGDPNPGQDLSSLRTVGVNLPNLTITLADSPDPIVAGNLLTYTLTVNNIGLATASGIVVQFNLPASGATFFGTTTANGFTAGQSNGVVTFSGGSINAASSAILTVTVLPTAAGTLTSGTAIADPANTIPESNEANNSAPAVTTTVNAGAAPTILEATTSTYVSLPANSPGFLSGVVSDPTDPGATTGIDFTIADSDSPIGNLSVSASSSNTGVVPNANLILTGNGANRNLKITPVGTGYTVISVAVTDGVNTSSYLVNYAASAASVSPADSRFHTGTSDASSAIMLGNNFMLVGDDENQVLRLYDRANSGLPVNGFDFSALLNLPDAANPEVDIEASVQVGNRVYWLGSHSNSANAGNPRPNRYRLFATDLSGSGAGTTLTYVGRYDGLRTDLLNWDASNGHGLGANFFGLVASAANGVIPEAPDGSGFNLEGLTIAPNGTTVYLGFRAPIVPTNARTKALIVPVTNFAALVSGNPSAGPASFGPPIQMDLGGRGIREIKRNSSGQYLIVAGPPGGDTGVAPKDFHLYTWTGNPADAPVSHNGNLTALMANGSIESVVDLPNPLVNSSQFQVLADNGDQVYYNDGTIAKELTQNNFKKFRSAVATLGDADCPAYTANCPTTVPNLQANNLCQAILNDYTALATFSGGCPNSANLSVVQTPPAGTIANPGTVAVHLTATTAAGQSATCVFNVTINGGCH